MLHRRFVSAACAAMLLVAACGSDDTSPVATDLPPLTGPATTPPAPETNDDETTEPQLPTAHDAWVRMPAAGQTRAAGYVTFVNDGTSDVSVLGVTASVGDEAELHETVADDDGVMRMQHRPDGFVVPTGGELAMAPGGIHVMLIGIDVLELATSTTIELVFDFGDAGTLAVDAEIRGEVPASMTARDDQHGHDDHHDDHHDGDHDDHHGDDGELGEPDANVLHDLDDELHAGVLEPERQRAIVADFRAALLASDLLADNADFDLDGLLAVLDELDTALAAGEREAAAAFAFAAHDLAHALIPHDHEHHGHSHHDHDHSHD